LFSSGVVVFILWRVPAEALWTALQSLDNRWLWPALASALATLGVRTLKWQRLLQAASLGASPRDVTRALFGGFALGLVTPGRLGEFGRCLFIPNSERAAIIALNILDRVLDSWSVATLAAVSLFLAGRRPMGIFAVAVWLAFLPVVLGLPHLISAVGERPWWKESFRAQISAYREAWGRIRVAPFAAWALVSTSLDVLTFFFLLRAFHPADFTTALATFPWIVMASAIPLSLGGLGLREGAAALLLAHYAVPAAVATDVALFMFAFLSLFPALLGGLWLLADPQENAAKPSVFNTPRLGGNLQKHFRMSEK
jgi:uncharacterized membrane protein YbhN (UPF0104 family)